MLAGFLTVGLHGAAPRLVWSAEDEAAKVDFDRDIRPILSDTCFACHGPDAEQRQADLRLDLRESVFAERKDHRIILPGDPAGSELYRRISSEEPLERMPPPDSDRSLTQQQIELFRRWIAQGAEWTQHWSFIPPKRPAVPSFTLTPHPSPTGRGAGGEGWANNPLDGFVLARLEAAGLKPSPPADKTTLIRRVTFDLTGLPPTPDEVDAFLADESPNAYEKLVDRLLASARYGEHQARYWLDAARYGDTHGLHLDNKRSIWPYREWVINAFNANMPFDQFTIEQLAGDLLPNPTVDQLVATGFNRCNVTTSEGGAIPEEYQVKYAVDRVDTTSTVWMGLTMGCAVCHDHKYDPIAQKEFYELFAYFNNLTEKAMDGNAPLPPPTVKLPTPEQNQQQQEYHKQLADIGQQIQKQLAQVDYEEPQPEGEAKRGGPREFVWIEDALPSGAKPTASGDGPSAWQFVSQPGHPVYSGTKSSTRTAEGLSQHFFTEADPGLRPGAGDVFFAYVYLDPKHPPREIMLQFNDGTWEHRACWGDDVIDWGQKGTPSRLHRGPLPETGRWVRLEVPTADVGVKPNAVVNGWAFTQFGGTVYWDRAGIVTSTPQQGEGYQSLLAWEAAQHNADTSSLPSDVRTALSVAREQRSAPQQAQLRNYFIEHVYSKTRAVFEPLHQQRAEITKKLEALQQSIAGTLIMQDMPEPRQTYVLTRGQYDKPDKDQPVQPGVPAALPPLPEDAPPNRLALARWLVNPGHPLTARVTVNRFWQQYFGTGIVKTTEDFGAQGDPPTHPKLLDWLAVEFIESGWDVKHVQRLIVTSATYRQSSRVTPELMKKDPDNRLLSRGPRFRIDAEMVRDNALAVSGLLVEKIGGPSVKPYQPPGIWQAVGYTGSNTVKFVQDHGDALYRRSVYTFWKRTAPPPSMSALDAPSRESCTVRRARTNTPLQALLLMNDTQFVEAARHLAGRMMTEGGTTPEERIRYGFRLATARRPRSDETKTFLDVYQGSLKRYQDDPEAALKLVSVGESPRDESLNTSELAAWTMIANLILNLDETVTKG